jgi:hypothetical protein
MNNTINDRPRWLGNLRLIARVISIVFIIIFSEVIMVMGFMMNRPATSDYILLASCSTYVIGLLIGFKLEGLGGIISLGFVVTAIIYSIYWDSGSRYDGTFNIGIYIQLIVLLIPCILYFLSWYFHRKFEINHQITEKPPNEN